MHTLLTQTKDLVKKEKYYTYLILNNLKKINDEKLFCDLGYSSLHAYLEKELGYSSGEAALRVANVKLISKYPQVEKVMAQGKINLTQGGTLFQAINNTKTDHLDEKMADVLPKIIGTSTRESEKIIAETFQTNRKTQNKIILNEQLQKKLDRLKKFYGEKSYEELLEILVDEKLMTTSIRPSVKGTQSVKEVSSPKSRYIPIDIKRAVFIRAQKQCEYKTPEGIRCTERRNLEFEHVTPYSFGGGHSIKNLKLFCRGHNQRSAIVKMPHKTKKRRPIQLEFPINS